MDKKIINTLLLIVSAGFVIAGMIFLLLTIFNVNEDKNNWVLFSSLFCIALANLFNLIRISLNRKDK